MFQFRSFCNRNSYCLYALLFRFELWFVFCVCLSFCVIFSVYIWLSPYQYTLKAQWLIRLRSCVCISWRVKQTGSTIDNRKKKLLQQQYLAQVFLQYGELRPTNGWDLLASLGYPIKFQRVSRLGSVTAWHSSNGCQPNFAALNRGRHLYSAGRPSRWALTHILVIIKIAANSISENSWLCCFRIVER